MANENTKNELDQLAPAAPAVAAAPTAAVAAAAPRRLGGTPGGIAYNVDSGLSAMDKVGGFIGSLLLPGAAGAGVGYGIVRLAGDKLPAKYAVPVVLVSAVVMVAGKVIIHEVAKASVRRGGNLPAHQRWDLARAERYIEAARKAGISEERIFSHLQAAGAPVAGAPQMVAAAG